MADAELVGRAGWEVDEAARDLEVVAWVARFRFVTAELLARRLGVSVQRANARVRRLEHAGLLARARGRVGDPRAIYATRRGYDALGQPRRRPPRAETQRAHELAIVRLCTLIEHRSPQLEVLTEREVRARERHDPGLALDLEGTGPRRDRRHWPDLVVLTDQRRVALELEFTPKGTSRLATIIDAYTTSRYDEVRYVVTSPTLAARVIALARSAWEPGAPGSAGTRVVVAPWLGVHRDAAAAITQANHAS